MKFTPIKSKIDGFSRAKRYHLCTSCRHYQAEKFDSCPRCEAKTRVYFPSMAELKRASTLLLLRDSGEISNLRFHPRYELAVNGQKITTYVADAEYRRDGVVVYEDTKPVNFMDDMAKIKIRLFEAVYGTKGTIPQRP